MGGVQIAWPVVPGGHLLLQLLDVTATFFDLHYFHTLHCWNREVIKLKWKTITQRKTTWFCIFKVGHTERKYGNELVNMLFSCIPTCKFSSKKFPYLLATCRLLRNCSKMIFDTCRCLPCFSLLSEIVPLICITTIYVTIMFTKCYRNIKIVYMYFHSYFTTSDVILETCLWFSLCGHA